MTNAGASHERQTTRQTCVRSSTPPSWPLPLPLKQKTTPLTLVLVLLLLLTLTPGCSPPSPVSERAQLRMTTAEVGPGTGFELVLEDTVASFEEVGSTSAVPPLVVIPDVPGEFVWRSRRSGIFRPSAPWPLGGTVEFRLRAGLRDVEGKPISSRLLRRVEMPPFQVTLEAAGWWGPDAMPSSPSAWVLANAAMDRGDLARRAYFTDGIHRVGAVVESAPTNAAPWHRSWRDAMGPVATPRGTETVSREVDAALRLSPATVLVSTGVWKVVVGPGLRSTQGLKTRDPAELTLGRSLPFVISGAEARSTMQRGREVVLTLTRAPAMPWVTNVGAWLSADPPVDGLMADVGGGGRDIRVRGAFQLGTNYLLRAGEGMRSEDGVLLGGPRAWTNHFEPLAPNAWLPVFDAVQPASGSRGLELLTVNVPEVRVRVKSLDRHGLIPTLRGYERYHRGQEPWAPDTVPGAALDYAGIPGRTVHDDVIDLRPVVTDESRRTALGWDRLAGAGRAGAFFVEVDLHGLEGSRTRVGPQALVQCTDLGHVVKRGEGRVLAWVFRHRDARPVEGARVSLRTEENEELAWANTDASGLAWMASPTNASWVLVEHGGDLHADRLEGDSLNLWSHGLDGRVLPESGLRLIGFADRALVRPGEVMHVRLMARRRVASGWAFPGTNAVAMELKGPRGDVWVRTNLWLGAEGSGSWDWAVPQGVRGTATLEAEVGGASWRQEVQVREFQAPAFEVRVNLAEVIAPGDPVRAGVGAVSLQGRPLSRARVQWHAEAGDMATVPGAWPGFEFVGPTRRQGDDEAPSVERHEGGEFWLDATGPKPVEARLPMNAEEPRPQLVRWEVDVTDLDQKTLGWSREAVRHASAFYLGHRWRDGNEFTPEAGRPLPLEVVAMAWDGKPWTNAVPVTARLLRTERTSVQVERAGRSVGYETRTRWVEVGTVTGEVTPATTEGTRWKATSEIALPAVPGPGHYWVELTASDPAGRRVVTHGTFHVAGDARLAWHWKAGQKMELVPLRGLEGARETRWPLVVKAPFAGTALVTVERGGVARAFVSELRGNAPRVEVPLESGDAPNAFVGVLLVRGIEGNPHEHPIPEWRSGYASASMPPVDRRLSVAVAAARPVLRPRDEATVTVDVRDARGGAVAGAEVTLYAVDEAVLQWAGTGLPDVAGALEEPLALGVETSVSLRRILPEDPALRSFSNKGAAGGGGGRLPGMVRRNFDPAPYWNAGLRTDASGRVEARFAVPDALTRYRVVAVATHGADAAGTGAGTLRVEKPLMVEPSMPRVAHVGDRLVARAVVSNAGSNAVNARVVVRPGNQAVAVSAAMLDTAVTVPPGGSVPVDVEVTCASAGDDPWLWRVEGGGESDAAEARMPVVEPLPELRDARWLKGGVAQADLMEGLDPAVLDVATELTVRAGNGPWALLGEGVGHLLHYPYGCAEQTVSALVPWLALKDRPELLPEGGRDASRAIAAGLERLWSMQTASGGLAYWPGERGAQRWASAYGAWALAVAARQGVAVDAERWARLLGWLGAEWRKDGPDPTADVLHERCLTALALAEAGKGDAGLNEALAGAADRLTREDRCLLALAWTASGGPVGEASQWLRMPRRAGERRGWFGNEAREVALELLAWERCGGAPAEVAGQVARLLGQRSHGHWGTTQGNAWAVWALSALSRSADAGQAILGEVRVGARTWPVRLGPGQPFQSVTVPLTPAEARSGPRWVHVSGPEAWLEVGVSGRMKAGPEALARMGAVDRGFSVRRTYQRLDAENRPGPMDGLTVGDRVLVTVEVDAMEPARWVAIDDPVPSVLEASLDRWAGQQVGVEAWDGWRADFVEVRGARRRVFIDSLGEGRHRVRYVGRVRAAGTAVAGPVKVEAMYEPGRNGLSTPATVTAR